MAVNKVNFGDETLIDLTNDTVAPSSLAEGVTAHNAAGEVIRGTMPTSTVLYTAQTLTAAQKEQARENIGVYTVSVKDYGAKGNNSTDDTTAFQNALANERVVYVPGGKYKLSGELILGGNCQLELAQDAVLYFSQTSGNCISMEASAFIKGNHATVSVPYGFSGNVIYVDSQLNQTIASIPPFTKWDPQWKTGRYLTDLNIIKTDSRGFCYSVNGDCSGIAIYITCNDNTSIATDSNSIWGLNFSGVRIAGAFSYGIKAKNFNGTWNHEMRIEAFIDACEIGVGLEDCKNSYISATIQPRTALSLSEVETAYAKHGIELIRSRNVDLSGSRVWDWNEVKSLWTEYNEFQHLALIGDCKGTILNEYCYYATPEYDVRNNIYTDTSSNLDCLVIVQEPFTRWFKPIEDTPYFYDGDFTERLIGEQELSEILDAERTKNYTNALSTAKDTDGSVFYGKGYVRGKRVNPSSGEMVEGTSYGCTGFIPVSRNTTIYAKALYLDETAGNTGAVLYNSSFTRIIHVNAANLVPNKSTSYFTGYEATEKGFKVTVADTASTNNVAYIRFTFKREHIGFKPVISVGNPITYTTSGYLRDAIKVKTANVEGLSEILGSYINDVDVLLGGG